jgi:hypothetical protein
VVFSPHDAFKDHPLEELKRICTNNPLLFDIKGFYNKAVAENLGFNYITL